MRFIFSAIFALLLTAGYSQSDCLIVIPTRGTDSVVINTNQILYAVQAPSGSTANIVIADFSNVQTRITLDSLISLLPDLIKFTDSQNNYPTGINKQQIREIKRSSTNKAVIFVNWNTGLRYVSTQSYATVRALADACNSGGGTTDGNGIISALPLGSVLIEAANNARLRLDNTSMLVEEKFLIGSDSSFSHDPSTNVTRALGDVIISLNSEASKLYFSQGWSQFITGDGANGNMIYRNGGGAGFSNFFVLGTGAGIDTVLTMHQRGLGVYAGRSSDIVATLYANYLSSKGATNIIRLDNNGSSRLILSPFGALSLSTYGVGNVSASALSKTTTGIVATYASDGTLLDDGPRIFRGAGSPEGVITAPQGSLYTRTDGGANTTLYVKESGTGNTGWVAK